MSEARTTGPATRIDIDNDYIAVNEYFHERGWSDGLPVMPPTEDAVAAMIAGGPLPGDRMLGSCHLRMARSLSRKWRQTR